MPEIRLAPTLMERLSYEIALETWEQGAAALCMHCRNRVPLHPDYLHFHDLGVRAQQLYVAPCDAAALQPLRPAAPGSSESELLKVVSAALKLADSLHDHRQLATGYRALQRTHGETIARAWHDLVQLIRKGVEC